jgi:phage-related minor tail protein
MSDVFDSASPHDAAASATELGDAIDGLTSRTDALVASSGRFSYAIARAFATAATSGRAFEDVLKSLALRISSLAVSDSVKPLTAGISSAFSGFFSSGGGPGLAAAMGAIKPFAAGGVIGTPTYFPMRGGGLGLAGEAGPEAIMPLARGPDGRLGVATNGGGASTVNVTIATPDAGSFRRSEAYLTGQIARAVARGQRSL